MLGTEEGTEGKMAGNQHEEKNSFYIYGIKFNFEVIHTQNFYICLQANRVAFLHAVTSMLTPGTEEEMEGKMAGKPTWLYTEKTPFKLRELSLSLISN